MKAKAVTILAVITLVLAWMPSSPAESATPSTSDRPPLTLADPLDKLVEYHGRLGDIQGPIGVVVEFQTEPVAAVHARARANNLDGAARDRDAASQLDIILREQATFSAALGRSSLRVQELYRLQNVYNGAWLYVDAAEVAGLAGLPGVKALHPIVLHELDHATSVPLIGALEAWAGSDEYQGETIKVAVIDSGIDYLHATFGGDGNYDDFDFASSDIPEGLFPTAKVAGGWDFVGDNYDARFPETSTPVPDPNPMECLVGGGAAGHGTHVAGSVAGYGVLADGSTFSGDYADLVTMSMQDYVDMFRIAPGVAPKAELYALRVFGCNGSSAMVPVAIEWAVLEGMDIINMSLGSSFGSESDPSSAISNWASEMGVIVVASAGNSGDQYFSHGSPGVASSVISVASSDNAGTVTAAFEIQNATVNSDLVGLHPAGLANFGPREFSVEGTAELANDPLACEPLTNDLSGKIAVVLRGTCEFAVKAANAQQAGAIGILITNNAPGAGPMGMSGTNPDITIPIMSASYDDGNAIIEDLRDGSSMFMRLDSKATFFQYNPAIENRLSSFSSRGVGRVGNLLKPDIAAPGGSIYSAAVATSNRGFSLSGTSMAAPHMAGVMALLREQNPNATVAELKARVMNTATVDIWQALGAGTTFSSPSRVGAGRVHIPNALASSVIAYYEDHPERVSVSFGLVQVAASGPDWDEKRPIVIRNDGTSAQTYSVYFDARYVNTGIAFSITDAANNTVSEVNVAAGATETVHVRAVIAPDSLNKTGDPTVGPGGSRSWMAEAGGHVVFAANDAPDLRVPVHIAARAASEMGVAEAAPTLPADQTGSVSLTPTGTPVYFFTPGSANNDFSLVSVLEWIDELPAIEAVQGTSVAAADLRHIGAMGTGTGTNARVFFGVATHGPWDTPMSVEFDIYVDSNQDGEWDYVIYNFNFPNLGNDVFVTYVVNLNTGVIGVSDFINRVTGATNTNIFNNNVMVLPVVHTLLGLNSGNTAFDFQIVTFHRDAAGPVDISEVYTYDIANRAFSTFNESGTVLYDDDPVFTPQISIGYDKTNMSADTRGILLLHHHNFLDRTAEAVILTNPPLPDPIFKDRFQ